MVGMQMRQKGRKCYIVHELPNLPTLTMVLTKLMLYNLQYKMLMKEKQLA